MYYLKTDSTRHQSSSGFVLSNQAWQKRGSHQVVRLEPIELMKEHIQGLRVVIPEQIPEFILDV